MTNTTVTPLHANFRPGHLAHVISEMVRRGQPVIRGYFDRETGHWFAMEGTHRLRACVALGVTPIMAPVPWRRGAKALDRARYAAARRGHVFARVEVAPCQP